MQIRLSIYCEVNFERAGCQNPVTARSTAARLDEGKGGGDRRFRLIAQPRTISDENDVSLTGLERATLMERPTHWKRVSRDTLSLLFASLFRRSPSSEQSFSPGKKNFTRQPLTAVLRIGLLRRSNRFNHGRVSPNRTRFFTKPTKWLHVETLSPPPPPRTLEKLLLSR